MANQFLRGHTYGATKPDSIVTGENLQELVEKATALAPLVSDQVEVTALATGDFLLVWDASVDALRKVGPVNLLIAESITARTAETALAVDDVVLLWDASAGALRKATLANLIAGKIVDGVLSADTAGRLKMADGYVTLAKLTAGIVGDMTVKDTPGLADLVVLGDAAALNVTRRGTVRTLLAAGAYVSGNLTVPAVGAAVSASHGLGAVPSSVRVMLVCLTADVGYAVNEEVGVEAFSSEGVSPAFLVKVGATTVTVRRNASSTFQVLNGSDGGRESATAGSWAVKVYARV